MATDNIDQTAEQARRKAGNSASLSQEHMTRYARNTRTISGRLHDELVMMDLDQGKYFSLNPVATRVWDLLEKPMAIAELCDQLTLEYEVDVRQCIEEVGEHIDEMLRLGLISGTEK